MISISKPDIDNREIEIVSEVLKTGMLVQGKNVAAFENEMLNWLSPDSFSIAVSNGTAALHLSLLALGVKSGDFVIVPTYSWPATANAVELCGAEPIFVDIEAYTWGMDPKALSKTIEAKKHLKDKLKAVIVVHAFGCPCDLDAISEICRIAKLPLIEDAACAIGSTWKDKNVGTIGDIGCFSFHPRKIVTTGEGGLISVKKSEFSRNIRALRNHGQDPEATMPDFIFPGFNYRMTDFQAAMGVVQLKKLNEMLNYRLKLADIYLKELSSTSLGFQTPFKNSKTNWQTFVVTLPATINRDEFRSFLSSKGIATNIGTYHIPLINYYQKRYEFKDGDFPITDVVAAQSVSLPLHNELKENDIIMISNEIKLFFKNLK